MGLLADSDVDKGHSCAHIRTHTHTHTHTHTLGCAHTHLVMYLNALDQGFHNEASKNTARAPKNNGFNQLSASL